MTPRSQPYRVAWPLSPQQVQDIDEMFQILFDDVRNDSIFPPKEENTVLRVENDTIEWGKVDLTTDVENTLPVANGGTNTTNFTAGSVIFAGTSGTFLTEDNANLFYDDSNNRLGVRTNSPQAHLHIGASGNALSLENQGRISWRRTSDSAFKNMMALEADDNFYWDSSGGSSNKLIFRGVSNSSMMTLDGDKQNLLMKDAVSPATGSGGIFFSDNTAPSTMAANTAGLYANDVSGTVELFAINEADEVTQLTGVDIVVDHVVMSDGGTPPTPVDDGFGNFVYVEYTP